MSLLTDREIKDIEMYARSVTEWNLQFARAIEAAVIKKLATVSVEPVAFHAQDGIVSVASHIDKDKFLFTTEAITAARVQGENRIVGFMSRKGWLIAEAIIDMMRREERNEDRLATARTDAGR